MTQTHKITITILIISICSTSGAQEFQTADSVASKCATMEPQAVSTFENRTGIAFTNAVTAEFRGRSQLAFKSPRELSTFCNSIAGKKYGFAKFTSKPKKADIFVDGDPQMEKTNTQLHFPIGDYNWKIKFADSKECTGSLKVEESKVTSIHCNKP